MAVKEIVVAMNRVLEPAGFFRRGKTWNRKRPPFVDVIDLQKSKSADMVTINLGVFDREVSAVLWSHPIPAFVQEVSCTIRVRLAELIDNRDKWWDIDADGVPGEVADNIATRVLPFLETMHTREAMKQWLISTNVIRQRYPPPIISLAILEYFLGDAASGCAILAELQEKTSGGWKGRVGEIAEQLRCVQSDSSGAKAATIPFRQ